MIGGEDWLIHTKHKTRSHPENFHPSGRRGAQVSEKLRTPTAAQQHPATMLPLRVRTKTSALCGLCCCCCCLWLVLAIAQTHTCTGWLNLACRLLSFCGIILCDARVSGWAKQATTKAARCWAGFKSSRDYGRRASKR